MIVTVEQVKLGVVDFIKQEAWKKTTGIKKCLCWGASELAPEYVQYWVDKAYSDPVMLKKFFDESGSLKLDAVYEIAKRSVENSGQFYAFGFMLNESDIDKLYAYIAR